MSRTNLFTNFPWLDRQNQSGLRFTKVVGTGSDDDPHIPIVRLDTVDVVSAGFGASVSFTRTADTNAYAANDVIGSATGSTAALTFTPMSPAAGGEVMLTSAQLEIDAAAVPSGMTSFQLALYSVTPPSAYGDNAAWDLASGDRASFLGLINIGTPVDIGSTLVINTDVINKQITVLATASLFGYLITNGGFTPASGTTYKINLHGIAL